MKNELIEMGVDLFNAIAALKLKRHALRTTADGVEIRQPGRPVLLLTYQAARDYANETDEAQSA